MNLTEILKFQDNALNLTLSVKKRRKKEEKGEKKKKKLHEREFLIQYNL